MRPMLCMVLAATILWATVAPAEAGDRSRWDRLRDHIPRDVALRLSQGGLKVDRDPDEGALGGGLLGIDVKLGSWPLWISAAGEYYKKSAAAKTPWEIDSMESLYLLYKTPLHPRWRSQLYGGFGIGQLTTGTQEQAAVYTGAAGANIRLLGRFGLSVEARYLRSRKSRGGARVVDFDNRGLLVGFLYDWSW